MIREGNYKNENEEIGSIMSSKNKTLTKGQERGDNIYYGN